MSVPGAINTFIAQTAEAAKTKPALILLLGITPFRQALYRVGAAEIVEEAEQLHALILVTASVRGLLTTRSSSA
jgi:hypothetical protein